MTRQEVPSCEHLTCLGGGKGTRFARRQSHDRSAAGKGQCRQFQLGQTQWSPRAKRRQGNMAASTLRRKVGIEAAQCLTNAAMLREHIVRCRGQYLTIGAVACTLCEQTCGGGECGKAQAACGAGKILRKTPRLTPILLVGGGRKR